MAPVLGFVNQECPNLVMFQIASSSGEYIDVLPHMASVVILGRSAADRARPD
jgi:hypothetical protein